MPGDLFVVGVSWRTAPVSVREQLAFPDDEVVAALAQLTGSPDIDEAVILSTCNRVEIYGAIPAAAPASALASATAEVRSFLSRSRRVAAEGLADHLYERTELDAVRHLFQVAAALDSMVVGETQILGQLKHAYGAAVAASATGPFLARSMEKAFGVAKRVRAETGVSRGAANVSTVAVELARHVFGDLVGKAVLVVGAGKMSALAARHLRADGATALWVCNRSLERAQALATEVDGEARGWDELEHLLGDADVVLSSTGAAEPVLSHRLVKAAVKARRHRPLVIVDIAVPRDAEPSVGKLDGVYLFDIDDLQRVVRENLKERQKEADAAQLIVDAEVDEFARWVRNQKVVPTIRSLREHFHAVASTEAERCLAQVKAAKGPAEVEEAVRRMSQLIANKLLHTPMTTLKRGDGEIDELIAAAERLFGLDGKAEPAASPSPIAAPEATGKPQGAK